MPTRGHWGAREPETRPLYGSRVRASGWPVWRGLLQAADHGPSGEVDPWCGEWRRKERGGRARGGGEVDGGDGGLARRWWRVVVMW